MTIYVHYMSENRNISDIFFSAHTSYQTISFPISYQIIFRMQSVQVNIV